jgi:hypothetical protein
VVSAFKGDLDNVVGTGDRDQHVMFARFASDAVGKAFASFDIDAIGP